MSTSLYGGIIKIGKDGQPIQPELVLANRRGQKLGVINNVESLVISNHLMEACEISFDIHKIVDGEECQFWDKIKDFKFIYIPDLTSHTFNPWYELSVEVDEQDSTVKHCEGVHAQEAELSQLTLNGVEINTEDDIDRDDYVITKIYDPDNADGSLLDRILHDKASHYSIYHVDDSIAKMQRTFSWDGDTIKDAFDDIADEVECIFVYGEHSEDDGKIHRTISVYDLNDVCMDCGERGSFEDGVCTKCGSKNIKNGYGENSGIFLNHENFASSITYSSNKDEVKNCFRLVAGDDLMTATVRNINPNNSQYIWYLSDELRADMSSELQTKLAAYDADYAEYESTKKMDIPEDSVDAYNTLVDRYIGFDDTLVKFDYPIVGYSTMTDLYYEAMNLYTLLQTTLAPASEIGTVTTAAEQIKHLTAGTLSPLGIQDASKASAATVTSMLKSYAKTFYDTSLYSISLDNTSYSNKLWTGTITLTSYSDEDDTATTDTLSITVTDATADYLKTQIEKVMKKNETDATGTVNLFSKSESEFKKFLTYYSVDNLEMLSQICRGCMDVLIEQGCADSSHSLYSSMYIPYYNKYQWIEEELNVRESEVKVLVTDDDDDSTGLLNYIEKLRNKIAKNLDLQTYLGDELWTEFCSFRRDDEYQNDNFISDGLTDNQLIAQAKEFLKRANSEIKKSATLQHTISCNLNNLLLVERNDSLYDTSVTVDGNTYSVKTDDVMSPLLEKFDVGGWIYLEVDGNLYKLRFTDYTIDFDSLDTIDVEFSDVVYSIGSMSDIQSVLSKAQSMSTSYSYVQRQASDGSNANSQITNMVSNGLSLTNTKIVNSADNQNLVYDDTGMIMRALNDYGDAYNDEQIKIINSGLYFTKDNWKTVETGVGKFIYYDPEVGEYVEDYGLIANKIVGNIILGNDLRIYNDDNTVNINENGLTLTAEEGADNSSLFTVQKENADGTYNKYLYIDSDGNLQIDATKVTLSGDYIYIGGKTATEMMEAATAEAEAANETASKAMSAASAARNMSVILSSDYQSIPVDSEGKYTTFPDCSTTVTVMYGSEDVTSSCNFVIAETKNVTGSWSNQTKTYKVTALSADSGYVDIKVAYLNTLVITKRFKVAKLYQGSQGDPGSSGTSVTISSEEIRYQVGSSGTDIPTGTWYEKVQSTKAGEYLWTRTIVTYSDGTQTTAYSVSRNGSDGTNGVNGKDGKDGTSNYVHIKYSAVASPTDNQMTETPSAYIGICVDTNVADPTTASSYEWSKFQGDDGEDGTPGKDGTNGASAYVHFAYATSSDGKTNFSTKHFDGATYMGVYTDSTQTDSTSYTSYVWSKIKGDDGGTPTVSVSKSGTATTITVKNADGTTTTQTVNDGEKGTKGDPGSDGKTPYIHIKYSDDGGKTFTANSGEAVGKYLGRYEDYTEADSTKVSDYTWALIRGEDGTSVTISSKEVKYQAGSSGTTAPTGTWQASIPSTSAGQYLWTRTTVIYSDGTTTQAYSVSRNAVNGTSPKVSSTKTEYVQSSNGTTTPSSGWSTTPPTATAGQYIWTKTTVTYSDGNTSVSYSVSKNGTNGVSPTVTSTAYRYAQSSSSSSVPSSGWQTTPITSARAGYYIWVETKVTYSDGKTSTSYSLARNGADGADGVTYQLESSSNTYSVGGTAGTSVTPSMLTFSAYRYTESSARTAFAGRFKIQATSDNLEWIDLYTSNKDESSVSYYLYAMIADADGALLRTNDDADEEEGEIHVLALGFSVGVNTTSIRCQLYAAGGTTTLISQTTVTRVVDASTLTQSEVFDLLTDGGQWKGLYKDESGNMYISFDYARGGSLTLGGDNNVDGSIEVYDGSGNRSMTIGNAGLYQYSSSIQGREAILFRNAILYGFIYPKGGSKWIQTSSIDMSAETSYENSQSISDDMLRDVAIISNTGGVRIQSDKYHVYTKSNLYTLLDSGSSSSRWAGTYINDKAGSYIQNSSGTFFQVEAGTNANLIAQDSVTLRAQKNIYIQTTDGTTQFSNTAVFNKPSIMYNLSHVSSGGHLVFAADGWTLAYLSSSSERYKEVKRDMSDEDCKKLYAIQPVIAKYKDGYLASDDALCGAYLPMFIAEDVCEHFPEASRNNPDGEVEDWNERVMIPAMFQMIKSQKSTIDSLAERIEKLESLIQSIATSNN